MGHIFSSTGAAICGTIALVEVICVVSYIIISSIKLRKKIVSMGRIIPIHLAVFQGTVVPSHVVQVCPSNPNQTQPPPSGFYLPQQPPPQPGFYPPQDCPPPYEQTPNPNLILTK
ncbi:uncharacterized protein LOC123008097 [Tribolium madens]|uniref:uncharacterized protein LOC123008097 n=1 Tax=Tribolium madens TaxID=41895 RepID=UPI001CF73893|nr:uncharacterized protein LOC123008097 [Tribolium madens]